MKIKNSTIKAMKQAVEVLLSLSHLDKQQMDGGVASINDTIVFLVGEIEKYE